MQPTPRAVLFVRFSNGAAIAVALVGAVVLLGWLLDITALKNVLPHLVSMKANTALSFLLLGGALLLLNADHAPGTKQRAGQVLAAAVVTLACLTLLEYIAALDLGIDQLLFTDDTHTVSTSNPGRMAPMTAVCLALSGVALLLINRNHNASRRVAMAVMVLATLGLAGYAFGVQSLYRVSTFTSIALHTTITLILLSLGIIAARPANGCTATLASDASGGVMARQLLLLIPVLLFALGWLSRQGEIAGLFDARFAYALIVVSGVLVTSIIIMSVAKQLNLIDQARQKAQEQLVAMNAALEEAVVARTHELETANQKLRNEVAERQHAEDEVRRLSITDEMTGLLNRRGFLFLAEQDLKVARRAAAVHALFFIDLDGLKAVNDTYGHKAGDGMLKDAAQLLKTTFRDSDIVARLGGDEFAILATNGAQFEIMLARIQAGLDQVNRDDTASHKLSFSTGLVLCQPDDQKSILELLADADARMYEQKQERRRRQ